MKNEVKKAIIPVAGLGSRFLPLTKIVPKELWPLVDKPVLQYIVEEAYLSGIKEIIFVNKPGRLLSNSYFSASLREKKTSFSKYKSHFAKDLEKLENISKHISFSHVLQKQPFGNSHAILQAEKLIGDNPCAVLWADDVVESKVPCLKQLAKVFEKHKGPVIALYKVPKTSFQFYGMVKGKKIAERTYKIESFIEKPAIKESPSNLAIVGKYVITPRVFDYLKKTKFDLKSDITLSATLADMAKDKKDVYGYEFEGKWLECGNKLAYLKSNIYLSLKDKRFGQELKKFIKKC